MPETKVTFNPPTDGVAFSAMSIVSDEVEEVVKKEVVEEKTKTKDANAFVEVPVPTSEEDLEDIEQDEEESLDEEEFQEDIPEEFKEDFETFSSFVNNGRFIVPEDFQFDPEDIEGTYEKANALTLEYLENQATNALLSKINDPVIKDLVEFGVNNGRYTDFKTFVEKTIETNIEYFTDEDEAREYLENILSKQPGITQRTVRTLLDEWENQDAIIDEANERLEKEKESNKKAIEAQKKEAENRRLALEKQQREYQDKFMKELNEKKFSDKEKENVLGMFENVVFEDGTQMTAYDYKHALVRNHPEHFIQFIQILNSYDPEKGFAYLEKISDKKAETKAAKRTWNVVRNSKKSKSTSGGSQYRFRGGGGSSGDVIV